MALEIYYNFVLTLALILIAARLGGEIVERYFGQPPVLGELVAGIAVSPFALGGLIFPGDPILLNFGEFELIGVPHQAGTPPLTVLDVFSMFAVIVLLFAAGVETDVKKFMGLGKGGAAVAFAGVVLPFFLGYTITSALGYDFKAALFMGAVLTATSIGLTVRILMDMKRLDTPEGITILVAAVVDDIIGIVILGVVVAISITGAVSLPSMVSIGVIGFAVWFAIVMIGVRFHKYISMIILNPFKASGTMPVFALIFGFLVAYLTTIAKLHPVIGAYAAGLMFAATAEKEEIVEKVRPIMLFIAPLFFVILGMQVDLSIMAEAWKISIILIIAAVIGKLGGCYLAARLAGGFNHHSSMIIGVGMVPRGEVGLVTAGAGFIAGAISRDLFGAAVAVSVVTTLITPAMLKPLFRKKPEEEEKTG